MTVKIAGKKIGILTYHDGFNFGAFLQVYALQRTLKELGLSPEVIDYKSRYHSYREYKCLFYTRRPKIFAGGFLKMLAFFRAHKKLNLSPAVSNVQQLSKLNYPAVVFGSDEIWNYQSPIVKLDPLYFGVGVPAVRRISYAASCGTLPKDSEVPEVVQQGWRSFDHISVRDDNSKAIVSKYVETPVELVLDPTFLADFSGEEVPCPESDFILVYTIQFSPEAQKAAREYATQTGKRLISIGYRNTFCDENVIGIGPFEFLGYVKAASVILTSMFHGTIFAIKYQKPFVIFVDPYRTNKLATMLKQLELTNRVTDADGMVATLSNPIDYPETNRLIAEGIKRSKAYLQRVCRDIG